MSFPVAPVANLAEALRGLSEQSAQIAVDAQVIARLTGTAHLYVALPWAALNCRSWNETRVRHQVLWFVARPSADAPFVDCYGRSYPREIHWAYPANSDQHRQLLQEEEVAEDMAAALNLGRAFRKQRERQQEVRDDRNLQPLGQG